MNEKATIGQLKMLVQQLRKEVEALRKHESSNHDFLMHEIESLIEKIGELKEAT